MKKLAIIFFLFVALSTQAQNACEFDSIYKEPIRDEKGCKTIFVDGNLYLASIKGYSDGYTYNNLFLQLTCLNTCGERIWKKQMDSSLGYIDKTFENLRFIDFIKRQNNTLLIACNYSNVKTSIGAGIKLFNLDLGGNIIWKKTFGDTLSNYVLTTVTEINPNRYLMAGQKNGKAYFLICDTLAQIKQEGTFSIDTFKTSLIQKVQIMADNTIKLLGLEDTIAFIKTIDMTGILINSINIPTLKSNKINNLSFNHDNSKIIVTGLPYIAQYSLMGSLMRDTILPDVLLNQIKVTKSYITSGVHINLEPNINFLNTRQYWIKLDSNYNFISKDSFYFQIAGDFNDFIKIGNSICGTGSLYSSGGLGHLYYSTAIKKINLINYVTSISITGPYAIYTKDGTLQLNVNILPINANNKKIIWSIKDSTIASINQNGLVTAKKDGIAIIYATTEDGSNLTAQKTISVNNQNVIVQQISIIGNDSIFVKNGFLQLSTQVLPTLATNKNILWSISDSNLATITQTGLLTAKANGKVIVNASAADGGGVKANKTITISNQNTFIQQISIIGNDSIFTKNGSLQLSTQILPSDATNKQVIWSVYDTNLASVTPMGLLMAKANGTVIVTATSADGGGAKATKAITITNQSVAINEVNLTNQITIYPNPASNVLAINQLNANFSYKIINLQGQEILNGELKKPFSSIDISKLENGSYMIGLTTETSIYWKKFVKN